MTLYRVLYTDSWGKRMGFRVDNKKIGDMMIDYYIDKGYTNVVFDEFDPEELKRQDEIKKIAEEKAQAELKEKTDAIGAVVFTIFAILVLIIIVAQVPLAYIVLGAMFIGVLCLMLPFIANVFSSGAAVGVFIVIVIIGILACVI